MLLTVMHLDGDPRQVLLLLLDIIVIPRHLLGPLGFTRVPRLHDLQTTTVTTATTRDGNECLCRVGETLTDGSEFCSDCGGGVFVAVHSVQRAEVLSVVDSEGSMTECSTGWKAE